MKDPLDHKIDALLASRPLKASDDFTARVLAAAEAAPAQADKSKRPMAKTLAFALPLAAAIALTFSLLQLNPRADTKQQSTSLSSAEAQEIFLLEESLSGLATLDSSDFDSENLLSTLEALYLEI